MTNMATHNSQKHIKKEERQDQGVVEQRDGHFRGNKYIYNPLLKDLEVKLSKLIDKTVKPGKGIFDEEGNYHLDETIDKLVDIIEKYRTLIKTDISAVDETFELGMLYWLADIYMIIRYDECTNVDYLKRIPKIYERILELNPFDDCILFRMGLLLFCSGDRSFPRNPKQEKRRKRGLEYLEMAVKLRPYEKDYRELLESKCGFDIKFVWWDKVHGANLDIYIDEIDK